MYPQYWTPSIGGTYQNRKAEAAAQKYGAAASAFYLLCSLRVPTVPFRLIPPLRKGVFCPPHLWPGFPMNGRSFCRKVVLCPEKKHRKTASAIYSAVSYRFYNVFLQKKALQMNFKNILYNYRFSFFTQIVSYRFVWGSRVCAFCTASALR